MWWKTPMWRRFLVYIKWNRKGQVLLVKRMPRLAVRRGGLAGLSPQHLRSGCCSEPHSRPCWASSLLRSWEGSAGGPSASGPAAPLGGVDELQASGSGLAQARPFGKRISGWNICISPFCVREINLKEKKKFYLWGKTWNPGENICKCMWKLVSLCILFKLRTTEK